MSIADNVACETPMSDHVARFWNYLENDTVRICLDLKRTVGTDAPDGPIVYWDGSTFSDDVAKAIVESRSRMRTGIERLLIAGNHIATWRQPDWPDYKLDGLTRDQQCEHALRILGAGRDFDMWCCWSAMMQTRDEMSEGN